MYYMHELNWCHSLDFNFTDELKSMLVDLYIAVTILRSGQVLAEI